MRTVYVAHSRARVDSPSEASCPILWSGAAASAVAARSPHAQLSAALVDTAAAVCGSSNYCGCELRAVVQSGTHTAENVAERSINANLRVFRNRKSPRTLTVSH